MNPRLTPAQIDDILAAAEHVDVPAEQLVAAAAEIRATLLVASDDATWPLALPAVDDAPIRRIDPMRRARTVRVTVVAATLALALVLSGAIAGALPDPIRGPITRVAEFFGLDVPAADPAIGATTSIGDRESNSPATDSATGARRTRSDGSTSRPTGTPSGSSTTPTATKSKSAATLDPTTAITTPPDKAADGNGPPEDPGNGNAYGHSN